jgi:alpha-L-rhamnosidase
MYKAYGDRALLERHYEPMKRWAVYIEQSAVNGVRCGEDFKGFKGFGDWLNLEGGAPHDLIGTAYFAHAMATMRDIAGVLGHDEDAVRFARARETAVAAFNLEFVSPAGRLASPTQTAHLMALGFDMLPEAVRPVVFAELIKLLERKDWHLATGFLGTPLMCPVLTRFGRIDLAYKVLMQVTYPGWLFPVVNGATTMWERWNSWTPDAGFGDVSMNSFNHYAYGAVGKWIYTNIGGIDLDESRPPERRLIISPRPGGGIRTAEARLLSRRGEIRTQWTLKETTEGDELVLNAHVPPNTTAHVHLPDGSTHQAAAGDHLFRSLV